MARASSSDSAVRTPATALMRGIHPLRRPVVRRPRPRIQSETHLVQLYTSTWEPIFKTSPNLSAACGGVPSFFPRLSPASRRVVYLLLVEQRVSQAFQWDLKLETGNVHIAHWRRNLDALAPWEEGARRKEEGGKEGRRRVEY